MAAAFFDDPMSAYIMPDPTRRRVQGRGLFKPLIHYGRLYGQIDTVGDGDGVAIWVQPRYTKMTFWRLARSGMLWSAWRLDAPARRRFLAFVDYIEKAREQGSQSPHWLLFVLAVHPDHQGRGVGGALLRHGLRRAAAEGLPCRLDTTKPANVDYYRRYGFEVVGEIDVPDGGPRLWEMVCPPGGTDVGS